MLLPAQDKQELLAPSASPWPHCYSEHPRSDLIFDEKTSFDFKRCAKQLVRVWRRIGVCSYMTKSSLIIIGAGASGLVAAKELAALYNITLLEATNRAGGRICTVEQSGTLVEAGAEFVHGNLPITLDLLKQAGIEPRKVEGDMFRHKNGKFLEVEEMTEGFDGLLEKMEAVVEDITMQQLLDKHYSAPRYESLRLHVTKYLEGFDLADVSRASVQATLKEWKAEEEDNFRIPTGYQSLINFLTEQLATVGIPVQLNQPVKAIRWEPKKVFVTTSTGKEWIADKVLVTVPLSVLQAAPEAQGIHFEPALPFDKNMFTNIGFGAVIKLVFKFKKPFWQPEAGFILSDEVIPTWWTQKPETSSILTGWLGGPKALAYAELDEEALITKGLSSLANIYDRPLAALRENLEWACVFNWQKMEYVRGGYSYATTETPAAQKLIGQPVDNTIFFAGEAMYQGDHPGTVEAALSSGIEAAKLLKGLI